MDIAKHSHTVRGMNSNIIRDPRTWLLLLAITEKSLFRYAMLVINSITGIDGAGDILLHILYIVLILMCFRRGCRFSFSDYAILFFVAMSIIVTWAIYPDNIEKYMIGEDQFWPVVFPLVRFFIVGLFLVPNHETLTLAGKVSCLAVLVESLFVFFVLRDSSLQKNDDMSRAYFILLNVLFVINYAFDNKNIIGLAFSIIGLLLLSSMGTRGPVVISLAFITLKIVLLSISKGRGIISVVVLLALIWFVNSEYWNAFLFFTKEIIESLGLSTRVIDLAIQDETFTYFSERDEISNLVISKIKERPLGGWGVFGEWQFVGWSAHNMYLEILCHYGVIVGAFIILWILYINFRAFLLSKEIPVRGLLLMFACFSLVRGFFGGGFLTSPTFLMIGYCLQTCRKANFKYTTT